MRGLAFALPFTLASLVTARAARADGFDALAKPNASWTYEVTTGAKYKTTGVKVVVKVSAVHAVGAYTVVELDATSSPADSDVPVSLPTLIIGPDGLHSAPFFSGQDLPPAQMYAADAVRDYYDNHFIPFATLPGLTKHKGRLKLDRFGDDDRVYNVRFAVTQPKPTLWRVAWTGTYTVPEEGGRDPFASTVDYDPAVGITMICDETKACLRLVPAVP